ncbi:MAG: outer membrane lipoprotein chaperone LolA [Betaproteobacteria bacterium]|nr:MAG: outer membrane lipoprotein chaperone LolA [Betaproteobacteria bacterium]
MRILLGALALAFALAAAAASIERYKAFLDGTQSARAQFEQKVYDRSGKLVQQSHGSFVFQRPGRFRWVYQKPADQVIVGDGQRVWIYDRQLNQVTVRKLATALGSTPAALLAGASGIEQAFALSDAGEKDGLEWMEARPREREAGFEHVRLGFDAHGLQAMELTDNFGQNTVLRFSKLERNPKVNAAEFRFEPPKGADVLGEK